jgi:hypothetical protein
MLWVELVLNINSTLRTWNFLKERTINTRRRSKQGRLGHHLLVASILGRANGRKKCREEKQEKKRFHETFAAILQNGDERKECLS